MAQMRGTFTWLQASNRGRCHVLLATDLPEVFSASALPPSPSLVSLSLSSLQRVREARRSAGHQGPVGSDTHILAVLDLV